MAEEKTYYRVLPDLRQVPDDHYSFGYETIYDFLRDVRKLHDIWKNRTGECIAARHDFLQIRFRDTIDGRPADVWLPRYLLQRAAAPLEPEPADPVEEEIDAAFGFD